VTYPTMASTIHLMTTNTIHATDTKPQTIPDDAQHDPPNDEIGNSCKAQDAESDEKVVRADATKVSGFLFFDTTITIGSITAAQGCVAVAALKAATSRTSCR
jgi:hypothetical protein